MYYFHCIQVTLHCARLRPTENDFALLLYITVLHHGFLLLCLTSGITLLQYVLHDTLVLNNLADRPRHMKEAAQLRSFPNPQRFVQSCVNADYSDGKAQTVCCDRRRTEASAWSA